MASVSLRDVIGQVSLTAMVNATVPDLPRRLPAPFYGGTREKVEGNFFQYHIFTPARQLAVLTDYYAPSVNRQLRPIGVRQAMMFSTAMNIAFRGEILEALRNFEDYGWQEKGKRYVALQMADFRRDFDHMEDALALLILVTGVVYRTQTGEILPNSSGAAFTQQFGATGSLNNGTIAALTGVGGAWNSPTTNIWLQLETLRINAQAQHGYIPKIILYGKNIPTYISGNDSMQPYLSRNAEFRDEWVKKGFIRPTHDLGGYLWFPISDAGFKNLSGTTYQFVAGNDAVIVMPEPDESWWGWAEGSQLVPTTIDIVSGIDNILGATSKVYGRWAYSKLTDDPISLKAISGHNVTPFIRIPEVVYYATAV